MRVVVKGRQQSPVDSTVTESVRVANSSQARVISAGTSAIVMTQGACPQDIWQRKNASALRELIFLRMEREVMGVRFVVITIKLVASDGNFVRSADLNC